jgi:site-specific recombinase XerD
MSITLYQNEIVEGEVVSEQSKIKEAIRGLLSEIDPLSQKKYEPTIVEFMEYSRLNPGPMAVCLSGYLGWLREKGLAPSTINTRRVAIRRFSEWLCRVGYLDQAELLKVKDVKGISHSGSKNGNWLTKDELKCLLESPDTSTQIGRRDKAVLSFLIGTATRRQEITQFKWNQLVSQNGTWIIKNAKRKHHRDQEAIVVPHSVKKVLDEYMPDRKGDDFIFTSYDKHGNSRGKLTAQTIYLIVKKYAEMCGVGHIAVHDLRRSSAQNMRSAGLELEQIQLSLGHASLVTTQRYLSQIMDLEAIAKAAEL